MKPLLQIFLLLACSRVLQAGTTSEQVLPQPLDPGHYEAIWKKSPFTLSSAPNADETSNAGFAENLSLLGVTRLANAPFVALLNKTSGEKFLVDASPEGNPLGLSLVSISADTDPTQLVVTLKKGTETAVLRFDPSIFTASVSPAQVPRSTSLSRSTPSSGGEPPTLDPDDAERAHRSSDATGAASHFGP